MPKYDGPAVGWKFLAWSGPPRACNVPACAKAVQCGHVRVDNVNPAADRFVVVCENCYFKIQLGVDPGGDPLPEWEKRRRATTNPDR